MKNVNRTFPLLLTALLLLCGSLAFGQERTKKKESDRFKWYELKQDGYCGAQSIDGTTLIPLSRKYTSILYSTHGGGYFSFHKNNSYTYEGCCDKNGKEIIAPDRGYTGIIYWKDKDYIIVKKNDHEGICDLNGREIIAPERGYTWVNYYGDEGYIIVKKNDREGVCDLNGKEIIAPKYENLSLLFGEFVYNSRGKYFCTGVKYDGKTFVYANTSSSSSSSASSSSSNSSSSSSNGVRSVPQQPYSVPFNIYNSYQSPNAGSSNNGNTTTPKTHKCGLCGGTGRIATDKGVASFGNTKYCNECKKTVPDNHYHTNCPSCNGKGWW